MTSIYSKFIKTFAILSIFALLPACASSHRTAEAPCGGSIPIVSASGVEVAPIPQPVKQKTVRKKRVRTTRRAAKPAVKKVVVAPTPMPAPTPAIPLPLEPVGDYPIPPLR